MASSKKDKNDINEPWVGNYPPLQKFLNEIEARCDWQVKLPMAGGAFVEQWRARGSLPFLIVVQGKQGGWDIYTPNTSIDIPATLDDVRARIFFTPKADS